jgi:formylglycine-generating enzyme required for sulfatase activity
LRLTARPPAGGNGAAPADSTGSSGAGASLAGAVGAGAETPCPLPGGPSACPVMVAVPAGTYRIGSLRSDPDAQEEELGGREQPVAAFALSAHEITVGQWRACVSDGACPPAPSFPGAPNTPDPASTATTLPVTGISWDAAAGYEAWLSKRTGEHYRLPTELEWEYAARAGATTTFPWGNQLGQRLAHCGQCGTLGEYPGLAPVGSYPAQRGLHDMVGNAYEWVTDCWRPSHGHTHAQTASLDAACHQKVQKGGGFDSMEADMRPAARTHGERATGDPRVGFRIARQATLNN